MPVKSTIVVYDITDDLESFQIVLEFPNDKAFYRDQILDITTPQSITGILKAYFGANDVTAETSFQILSGDSITLNGNQVIINNAGSFSIKGIYTTQSGVVKSAVLSHTIEQIDITGTPVISLDKSSIVYNKDFGEDTKTITQTVYYKQQDITSNANVSFAWYNGTDTTDPISTTAICTFAPNDINDFITLQVTVLDTIYETKIPVSAYSDAKYVIINGPTEFIYNDGVVNTPAITLTQIPHNISEGTCQWKYHDGTQWQNIPGATNNTYVLSHDSSLFNGNNYLRIKCVYGGIDSNEVIIKKILNQTTKLIITSDAGNTFGAEVSASNFSQQLINIFDPTSVQNVTNDQTWELQTGGETIQLTPSDGKVTITRSDLQGSGVLKVTYNNIYTDQISLYDIKDGYVVKINSIYGNRVHFYSNGIADPAGQTLVFEPEVYTGTGRSVDFTADDIEWSLYPEPPIDFPTARLSVDGTTATVTIDEGFTDNISIKLTYTKDGNNITNSLPIIITSDGQGSTFVDIQADNGFIYTTQDVNETKTFTAVFYENGTVVPITDTENVVWYLDGIEHSSGSQTVAVTYGQINKVTATLTVEYNRFGTGNIYKRTISLSKLQLAGTTFLSLSASNGTNLTHEIQSTHIKQALYVNAQLVTADSYEWQKKDFNNSSFTTVATGSDTLTVGIDDVSVAATYKCIATYGSDTYEATINIVDSTDKYELAIKNTSDIETNSFKYTIDQTGDINSIDFQFKPFVKLGGVDISDNITIFVEKEGTIVYPETGVANGSLISIKLDKIFSANEVSTISKTKQVRVVVKYLGATFEQIVSITVENALYTWLTNWKNNTVINEDGIATGKLFIGQSSDDKLSGVYVGDSITLNNTSYDPGIIQLKDNEERFYVKLIGDDIYFHVGNDDSYIKFDTNKEQLNIKGTIIAEGNSNVQTISESGLSLPKEQIQYFKNTIIDVINGIVPEGVDDVPKLQAMGYGLTSQEQNIQQLYGHPNDITTIDGGKIYADSITQAQINADALFTKYFKLKDGGQLLTDSKSGYADGTAGTFIDKSSIEIYKDSNTYFRFDTTNGISLKAAGVTFDSNGLSMTKGSINLGSNKIKLNNDGSGQLANGKISWTTSGDTTTTGKIILNGGYLITIGKTGYDDGKLGTYLDKEKIEVYQNSNSYLKFDPTNGLRLKTAKVTINNNGLSMTSGTINLGSNKILLSNDGTGHVASGNFKWYADGSIETFGSIKLTSGAIYSSTKTSFSNSNPGFWLGNDSGTYKFSVGNKGDQKYLEFDGNKTYQAGDLFGQFVGDAYLYNVEFKHDSSLGGEVVYEQNLPQVYRYTNTNYELLKTYGSNQHYIVQLQNSQIQPKNQYQPQVSGNGVSAWTVTTSTSVSKTSSSNYPIYRVEVQVYKTFPVNYFKGQPGGLLPYQTLIFDFSDKILYGQYSPSTNSIVITVNKTNRTIKVDLKNSSGTIIKSITKQQRSDIEQIRYRYFTQIKRSSNAVANGMYYTFTTRDMGHQLVSIQIDEDAAGEDLSASDKKFDPNQTTNYYYGIVKQRTFDGVATQAYFADVQEKLWSEQEYKPGTPVQIKNGKVTRQFNPWKKIWIVSTKPGFLLGKNRKDAVPVALAGTVEVNSPFDIDDELCLGLNGKLKRATWFDKLLGKYIIGRIIKILDNKTRLLLLY